MATQTSKSCPMNEFKRDTAALLYSVVILNAELHPLALCFPIDRLERRSMGEYQHSHLPGNNSAEIDHLKIM